MVAASLIAAIQAGRTGHESPEEEGEEASVADLGAEEAQYLNGKLALRSATFTRTAGS